MDVTGGLADKLPALAQSLIVAAKDDEAAALAAFQAEVKALLDAENSIVSQGLSVIQPLVLEVQKLRGDVGVALSILRRIDGAEVKFSLGPEVVE